MTSRHGQARSKWNDQFEQSDSLLQLRAEIDAHVGRRMRERRQMMGMTQAGLGRALGISFQQVQKYERGKNRLSAGALFVVAHILHVTPGWFYEGL